MAYVLKSARYLALECHLNLLSPGDRVIDATMGNGHDTCTLAGLVGSNGKVLAFDIQETAVNNTRNLLKKEGLLDRCELFLSGHEHVLELVNEPVRLAVFNLGWLPGGDKTITTRWETTKTAIDGCLKLLLPGGVCTICVYPGHSQGEIELKALSAFLSSLPPKEFNVLHQQFINAGYGAPECFILQRQ